MLHKLVAEKFALEERLHDRLAMLILAGRINFDSFQEDRREPEFVPVNSASAGGSYYEYLQKVPSKAGMVAIIPIEGTMSRSGDLCSWGTEDIGAWMLEAYSDPNIAGIVVPANSGGGTVDGTELLAEIIRQRNKPVVFHVQSMAASACYWVASQADEIVMESATASEVGSIGVLAMHVDSSVAYEKAGYKVTIIRADGSDGKALFNPHEPLSEEIKQAVRAEMQPIRQQFIKDVKAGRPKISDESIFNGGMYNGRAAIKNGMADSIGFLGDAVNRVVKLTSKY